MSGLFGNYLAQKETKNAIDKKREEKSNSNNNDNKTQETHPKGVGAYLMFMFKSFLGFLIFTFISLGIIMSIQNNDYNKYNIPSFLQDFSNTINTNCYCFFDKIIKSMFNIEIGLDNFFLSIKQWLSTSYYKTLQTDITTYNDINTYLRDFFNIAFIKSDPNNTKSLSSVVSMAVGFLFFMFSPLISMFSSGMAYLINYLGPIYYNFVNFEILFNNGIIYFFINLWILFVMLFINLFLGAITGGISSFITGLSMVFRPYISDFSNFNQPYYYLNTIAVPLLKKISPLLVDLFLIYAAISSTQYVNSNISMGIWLGVLLINIPIIWKIIK